MKKINNLIIVVISVVSYILALYNLKNKLFVRFLISIAIFPILLIPKIFRKKLKISDNLEFMYLIFILFAYFLGSIVNLYDKINHYDTIMHTLSGIFEAYLAINLINKKNNKLQDIIFILGFVSIISLGWEIFEYISNILLKTDPQKVKLTGINDTMKDLIVALIGGISFIIFYRRKRVYG